MKWPRRRPAAELPPIGDDFDAQLATLEQGTLILARTLRDDVDAGALNAVLAEQLIATLHTQMETIRTVHSLNQNLHGTVRDLLDQLGQRLP